MRVLVTGAGGFLGAAVVKAGARAGHDLRAQTGPEGDADAAGRPVIPVSCDIPFVSCDITDVESIGTLAKGVDAVVHMAGPPSVASSFADAAVCLRVHVLGTETVVRLCRLQDVPRLVYISSAEVYGRPAHLPVAEDEPPAPRSPYGAAKVGAEAVVAAASRAVGLDAIVLRPFSVYGPGMRPDSVLGRIVEQVLQEPDGAGVHLQNLRPVRDYCHVDDVAGAVWLACTAPPVAAAVRVYNVGTGRGTSVADLAAMALAAAGRTGPVVEAGGGDRPAPADISELVADVARAREELGWTAGTTLEAGLRRVVSGRGRAAARGQG